MIKNLIRRIKNWFDARKPQPLEKWFKVELSKEIVAMKVSPPGKNSWEQSFAWSSIIKVCFKDEGLNASDAYYIFTTNRPESFVIPVEASGGLEFGEELRRRGLFPDEISIKSAFSTDGGFYCWPPEK